MLYTSSPDGWFPQLSYPYLAHGFGSVHVVDLRDGSRLADVADRWVAGWFAPTVLHCLTAAQERCMFWCESRAWVATGTPVSDSQGAWARDGHWASCNGGRVVYGGREIENDSRIIDVEIAGDWLAAYARLWPVQSPEWEQWGFSVFREGEFIATFQPLIPPLAWCVGQDGLVYYGDNRRAFMGSMDVSATTTGQDFPPRPLDYGAIANIVGANADTLCVQHGRQGHFIPLKHGAASWDAQLLANGELIYAYADSRGNLTVESVQLERVPLVALPVAWPMTAPAPEPPPVPEPPAGATMKLSILEKSLLIAFDAKYPVAAIPVTDEPARREWTFKLAQTFKKRVNERWGTKRADPNRPLSKDSIALDVMGLLYGFDVVLGEDPLKLNPNCEGEDITGQVFVAVPPQDWLGETLPPVPPPPTEPPTEPPSPSALYARVAEVEAFLRRTFKEF